ncbi:testis-expressed protein 44 [Oryctolagus cuniculus]|uniref:testis-expressed protein 44 n=1 Tax=Oryctolagus cuniculus TaxID=9986 RepID=UPI0038792C49
MNTEAPGEAQAAINPHHGPPEATLGSAAHNRSADGPAAGAQGQDAARADGWSARSATAPDSLQDLDQPTSQATSPSGDKDKKGAAPGDGQEPAQVTSLLPQEPGALQVPGSPQSPAWDQLPEDRRAAWSPAVWTSDTQGEERTPQTASVLGQLEPAAATPGAKAPSAPDADAQPLQANSPKAFDPDSGALLASESQLVMEEDSTDSSRDLQFQSFPPSPGGSSPPSPGPRQRGLGRPLDSDLYEADEENDYMRSMSSLLGGGEGSISSLADLLVWSESTMGMGMAVGFLASGHSSPTDLLHSTGPSLRSVSSILGNASSAFSSGLTSGTGSALRSVTHVLETVERRTMEGIRSAMRYLTSHLPLRRAHAGPNGD